MTEKKEEAAYNTIGDTIESQLPNNLSTPIISHEEQKNKTLIKFFSQITTSRTEWLWTNLIPKGKITVIQGDPGEGKTALGIWLASILSRGERLPTDTESDNEYHNESIVSIYLTAEDGLGDCIKPRLVAAGADCSKICTIYEGDNALSFTDDRLEEALIRTGAGLLILDPLQAYLGPIDMHRANEVRPVLAHLQVLAEKYNCAIILIGHLNKSGKKARYRGLGSIDITAAARSVLYVGRVGNSKNKRCLVPVKSNLGPESRSVLFSVGETVTFEGFDDININEVCSDIYTENSKTKLEQAKEFLEDLMGKNELIKSNDVEKMASELGIRKRILDEAKKELKIKSVKIGDVWHYSLK